MGGSNHPSFVKIGEMALRHVFLWRVDILLSGSQANSRIQKLIGWREHIQSEKPGKADDNQQDRVLCQPKDTGKPSVSTPDKKTPVLKFTQEENPADNALTNKVFDDCLEDFQIDKSLAKKRKLKDNDQEVVPTTHIWRGWLD